MQGQEVRVRAKVQDPTTQLVGVQSASLSFHPGDSSMSESHCIHYSNS